jgi:hypothetical protein
VDLDAYVLERAGEWDRMEKLARRRRLSAEEADELVMLYQRATTHLSVIRSRVPDPVVIADLSRQLLAGRAAITKDRGVSWRAVGHFVTDRFPAELYRARRWWISLSLLLLGLTAALAWYIVDEPSVAALFMSQEQIDRLAEDFVGYYSEFQAQNFAAQVWTNNAWLTAQCIAAGVLVVPVVYLLGVNMFHLGLTGGVMFSAGGGGTFLSYLTPHGLLELTCVFVGADGAGPQRDGGGGRAGAGAADGRGAGGVCDAGAGPGVVAGRCGCGGLGDVPGLCAGVGAGGGSTGALTSAPAASTL